MNIYENDSIGFMGDISGNELENSPEAYNMNSLADKSSNIDSLNIEGPCDDLKGNVDRCISDEYDKYAFFIKDDNNLYREIATQFGDIKNSVLEDFKDTDIFIESRISNDKPVDPLDYRTLLSQHLIRDINNNELYTELGIDYNDFDNKMVSIKEGMCENFKQLQDLEGMVNNYIIRLEKDSGKLLDIIDIFDGIDDPEYKLKFRECIMEGTKRIYMNGDFKDNIISYKKCIQKHLLYLRLINKQNSLNMKPFCPLCQCNEINITYNPCGHTTCKECYSRTNRNLCSICRAHIKDIIPLYIL